MTQEISKLLNDPSKSLVLFQNQLDQLKRKMYVQQLKRTQHKSRHMIVIIVSFLNDFFFYQKKKTFCWQLSHDYLVSRGY